jgi:uncharacterized low-complexity protein
MVIDLPAVNTGGLWMSLDYRISGKDGRKVNRFIGLIALCCAMVITLGSITGCPKKDTKKDTKTETVAPADTKTSDTKTSDTKTSDTKTSDTKTSDTKTGDTKTGDTKTGDTKTGDTKTGDTKTGDTKTKE